MKPNPPILSHPRFFKKSQKTFNRLEQKSLSRAMFGGDAIEPFEELPDVMNVKQLAAVLHLSRAGAYNLLNSPDFPTLKVGGRKLVMKAKIAVKSREKADLPIGTRQTMQCSSGAFLFENRHFLQVKSWRKHPIIVTIA